MGGATVRQCVLLLLAAGGADAVRACGDRPFLAWQLREFLRYGVEEFLLLTDAPDTALEAAVAGMIARLPRQVTATIVPVPATAGSGGAVFHARERLAPHFLLADGAALFDGNLAALLAAAARDEAGLVGRILAPPGDASRADPVRQARLGVFRRHLVAALRPTACLLGDILADLAATGRVRGSTVQGRIWHAPARDGDLAERLRRPALFLDRDGVLNLDHGYVGTRERFEWTAGALEAMRCATDAGWHVFVVTNQSGVARGYYDEDAVCDLLAWMAEQARAAGGTIDDTRYCPFHEDATLARYRRAHPWRKPAPGMLLDLIRAWELDPARCLMIGDQPSDMAAAAAAAVPGRLFPGGDLHGFVAPLLAG